MKKILIIGSVTVDYTSYVDQMPKSDEELIAKQEGKRISGFGWNCANLCHELKIPFDWIGPVGTGVYAEDIKEEAEKRGIELPIHVNEIHGCTYTVCDRNGFFNTMVVPGCEYTFLKEFGLDITPSDYECVLIGGMELDDEGMDDLMNFLQPFAGKVYFIPGQRGATIAYNTLEELYVLQPMMQVSNQSLRTLTMEEDLDAVKAMKIMQIYTENAMIYINSDGESVYLGEEEHRCSPIGKNVTDRSGCEEAWGTAFICARMGGIGIDRAMRFANEISYDLAQKKETVFEQASADRLRTMFANAVMEN